MPRSAASASAVLAVLLRRVAPASDCSARQLSTRPKRHQTNPPPSPRPQLAEKFELRDGDRVVLLGGTFIEREQQYGYLEAGLLSHFPGRKITVRNLGWSGDTVWGEARAGFGTAGRRLQTARGSSRRPSSQPSSWRPMEPTSRLPARPGSIIFAPDSTRCSTRSRPPVPGWFCSRRCGTKTWAPPCPIPDVHNENLQLYTNAIAQVAAERHLPFVNLFDGIVFNELRRRRFG